MTTIERIRRTADARGRAADWNLIRRRLAAGAMITTLPYLVLKVAWLCGSRVGLSDPEFGTSSTMHVLNGLTLGLDVVALALAVVFYTGARAPRWFVLPTMWVGYGLLGQIVMIIGPAVAVQLLSGPSTDDHAASPIAGWVYAAVYTGFSGLGLCLLPAFAVYAWQRWAGVQGWAERLGGIRTELPTAPTTLVGAVTTTLLVRSVFSESVLEGVSWAVDGLIGYVALLAIRAALRGRPTRLLRAVPLAAVWTVSGAWTAWGCFNVVMATVPNDLSDDPTSTLDLALYGAKIVAGALLLLTVRRLASPRS